MANLRERESLGERHRNYNKKFQEAIKHDMNTELTEIDYEQEDLENLLKIDLACHNRNVDYILRVFNCNDMLYVSRAIKKSVWLITDNQYAHIVNPNHLHTELSQKMSFQAFNKLILSVRLHLRDKKRVEEFFNYYKEEDLIKALKWLPNCSVSFIENVIEKHADDIPRKFLTRLCGKSIRFLEIFCQNHSLYYKRDCLLSTMFLLNKNIDKYLDIIEATDANDIPNFGAKHTKKIMETSRERVMKNLDKYVRFLNVSTFAKYIKPEEIKEFLLTHLKNKKMRSWFAHNKIKHFINRIPVEERFDFINKVFIEKNNGDLMEMEDDMVAYRCEMKCSSASSAQNVYSWYIYAPFNKAFVDLKQYIRNESNPSERNSILGVMLSCAGSDQNNIRTLLKYYRENHINEALKFKSQFINLVLTKTKTHEYDTETWGYLNDLFISLEVYSESDKNVQSCVRSIILYNIIHGENIPDVIENKFVFETLKNYQNKLNSDDKGKTFDYLLNFVNSKIKSDNIVTEKEFNETVDLIQDLLTLLRDWNKDLKDYPIILDHIKNISITKKENSWTRDLSGLYNMKKSWRKLLFAESLILNPSEESCINALKHGPEILNKYNDEVEALSISKNFVLKRFLKKIRIYCSNSLANAYKSTYFEKLDQKNCHKALVSGICILLSQKELLEFVHKYVPAEAKIDWNKSDETEHSLRKNISMCMYLARPQPSLTTALLYSKGDYLQYLLPSLNAILYNMSSTYTRDHITELFNTRVSLQKHGIRIALSKLKREELKRLFTDIWMTNKNPSIRADIFNQTYLMLCKQKDPSAIKDMWELLSMFIDNLHLEENRKIYTNLSKVEKVPLSVRPEFWMKSYKFLKTLPIKGNYSNLIDYLITNVGEIMEFLDEDLIAGIFMESFDKKFGTQRYAYSLFVAEYLLSTRTETAQNVRYNKIFVPIYESALKIWDKKHENAYHARINLRDILDYLFSEFQNIVLEEGMIIPITLYTNIINKLESTLPVTENYILLTSTKLELCCLKIFNDILNVRKEITIAPGKKLLNRADKFSKWNPLYLKMAPHFGKVCVNYLKEEVTKYFPSIYIIFAEALDEILNNFTALNTFIQMDVLKAFLESEDFIEGHLLVLKLIPQYLHDEDEMAVKWDILNKISRHPSDEVKMHYWRSLK